MKLIVGLGNPGAKYERTRHNAGINAVRTLGFVFAQSYDAFGDWKPTPSNNAVFSRGKISGQDLILLVPNTYMNESGAAVRDAVQFWKIKPEDICIIFDDMDLPIGRIRLRAHGSAGGHNGMRSIIQEIGTNEFPRLRVGIAPVSSDDKNLLLRKLLYERLNRADKFVLGKFTRFEDKLIQEAYKKIEDAVKIFVTEGIEAAMNEVN